MIFSEIVVVGREILQGRVLDTNSNWIATQLRKLGIRVRRILVVDDDEEEIKEATLSLILRKPKLAFFTGGLGPTFDDITVSSVAKALNLELIEDELAIKYVAEMCAKRALPLTKERMKMAILPRGSLALKNEVGMAPGVYFRHKEIDFFLLPGVPAEMKNIFENFIIDFLKKIEGREYYREIYIEVYGIPESDLASVIAHYKDAFSPVYIKSHPKGSEGDASHILLHLSIFTDKKEELSLIDEVKEGIMKDLKAKANKLILRESSET